MKSNQLRNRIGGLILGFSVLCGIGLVSSSTVQAQWGRNDNYRRERRARDYRRDRDRRDDRYRNDQYRNNGAYGRGGYGNNGYNVYQAAQRQGYQQGINTGSSDAQRRQSYSPQRSRYFKNPPGSNYQYEQAYRNGFVQGYRQGYQRYGGYNGGYNNGNRRNSGIYLPW